MFCGYSGHFLLRILLTLVPYPIIIYYLGYLDRNLKQQLRVYRLGPPESLSIDFNTSLS